MLILLLDHTSLFCQNQAGSAAEVATYKKRDKYVDLTKHHLFVSIAMDSLGPLCSEAIIVLKELGRQMTMAADDHGSR